VDLNKQNKIYHNQQVVSMKFQFLLMITLLMLAAGQSLSQDKAIHFPTTEQEIFQALSLPKTRTRGIQVVAPTVGAMIHFDRFY